MRIAVLLFVCLSLFSCATLQVSDTRNASNVKDIGIEWNYDDRVNERYKPMIDSAITDAMNSFNAEKHLFMVHKKERKDKDYISIDFTKGKIVSGGEKAAGYILTTVGVAAIPILIVVESPVIFGFYYLPQNMLQSTIALSPSLVADKYRDGKAVVASGALFSSQKKQVPKVVVKYATSFKKMLSGLENKISAQ